MPILSICGFKDEEKQRMHEMFEKMCWKCREVSDIYVYEKGEM